MLAASAASSRGRWRWVAIVAALVIGALLVATAGVVIGRVTAHGPNLIVLPGPVVEDAANAEALETSGLHTPTAIFTAASDLDDTRTTASGYRLTRSGLDGTSVAAGLAAVFGLADPVVRSTGGWTVGTDTAALSLTVVDDPQLSWSFTDPIAAGSATGGPLPDPAAARQVAMALLADAGVALDSVDWRTSRFDDHLEVTAAQVVDGFGTGLQWSVGFGRDGTIIYASGFAADIVEVPGYEVVGAATAVRRAALPTWALVGPTPVSTASQPPIALSPDSSRQGPDRRPALQIDVASVVVIDATLEVAQFWQPDGDLLILPAYRLVGDDGTQWTLIAVTGDYVDFVDQPYSASP